jgi:hypothetical protein
MILFPMILSTRSFFSHHDFVPNDLSISLDQVRLDSEPFDHPGIAVVHLLNDHVRHGAADIFEWRGQGGDLPGPKIRIVVE